MRDSSPHRESIMKATLELSREVGVKAACEALNFNRASFYRAQQDRSSWPVERPRPPLALSTDEEPHVLAHLHSERFMDRSPYQVYAALLDEGVYLCSISTLYRILVRHQEVRERRNQLRRPNYTKPELLATAPNQVWSWDITKLKGPAKWTYFYLYVIIDIFSRCVVGWMVAHRESTELAKRLIGESCTRQTIREGQLTIHADRGSSMTSKGVEQLLADLGVTKTHSRPHVSNDNPYSEAQFKTLKYRPGFPAQFGAIEDARSFCGTFFDWYNHDHYHSGIALLTPASVHSGQAVEIVTQRTQVLHAAFERNPERFKNRQPHAQAVPEAAWINPPPSRTANEALDQEN
ncbi:Integrase, catalytic region [Methylotuvimicrobium alcaliphilum 20Z]|uniref:Integrase, catalytic region n=1 Tax=Methylotuvimicrobium alcaliphilum (strain DSM 19304 / NCIMB 14124 / VKM B-2133 / 20Z) TaxID=1091494 RepID=G4T2Y5_META2|nr:Integrase, catalytic region [Methylotuvimicrobium alcaliphilum 20Z]